MREFAIILASICLFHMAKAEALTDSNTSDPDSVLVTEREALRIVDELFQHRYSSTLKHVTSTIDFYWCTEHDLGCRENFIDTYAEHFTKEYERMLMEGELKVICHTPSVGWGDPYQSESASIELLWSYIDGNGYPGATRMLFILDDSYLKLTSIVRYN